MVSRSLQYLLCAVILSAHGSAADSCTSPPLPYPPSSSDISSFTKTTFDVLIVGGGTAGVALAARLAERPYIQVGVIEAGRFHLDDPIIDVPRLSGGGAGNPDYDWNFATTNQANAGGRSISITRGKLLGGSSAVNGFAWGRASGPEYDAWTSFASLDWSFSSLLTYFDRSENISTVSNPFPGVSQNAVPPSIFTGESGPLQAGHWSFYPNITFTVAETFNELGVATNAFPQNGNATGLINTYTSADHATGMRSYSAKAYYCHRPARSNLKILTGAQVTKVLFTKTKSGLLATDAQFSVGSNLYTARASGQVVLSAGSIQTPQILELSGIGNYTLLSSLGIPVLANLSTVGENLQEHLYSFAQFQLVPGELTYDILNNNATLAQEQMALYNATGTGLYANSDSTVAFLPLQDVVNSTRRSQLLSILNAEIAGTDPSSLTYAQLLKQRNYFTQGNVAAAELIQWSSGIAPAANQSYVTMLGGIMHPVSRGSVHIASNNPLAAPAIDPGFLTSKFDQSLLVDIMKYVFSLGVTAPFSDKIAATTLPPATLTSDAEILGYIQQTCANGGHLVGTAAMAPRSLGGVVDQNLKVYGTSNLLVVDASVIPLQIAAHSQATLYGIAEKAADIIAQCY